jgi:hypothetical protein
MGLKGSQSRSIQAKAAVKAKLATSNDANGIVNEGSHDNQTSIHMVPSEVENFLNLRTYPLLPIIAVTVSRQLYHYYQTIQVFLSI